MHVGSCRVNHRFCSRFILGVTAVGADEVRRRGCSRYQVMFGFVLTDNAVQLREDEQANEHRLAHISADVIWPAGCANEPLQCHAEAARRCPRIQSVAFLHLSVSPLGFFSFSFVF